jgi:hypothetical protein
MSGGLTGTWSLDGYRALLESALAGGYEPVGFDTTPRDGVLFLRHDVDLSLDAALQMAALERELGIRSTYFLMTESVFYNLASSEGVVAVERLRALGHRIGLHAVYPHVRLDARFDPVVAWHNPDPAYMTTPIEGAVNVMEPPWFDPATYRSDSNQHWRSGRPDDELRRRAFPWLQLLVHPEIWVYPGETMGETMRALLDAERERRLAQLAADRIDLS